MTAALRADESQHQRIFLLAGQAFALGLTMAWILIPASAIFLASYGSSTLPVTYIGAAVAGVVSSRSFAAALRKRTLVSVATITLAGLSVLLLASWFLLRNFDADWVSFGLLVLVPIVVPVGFMFVVGQAGMLLDVRSLKALYARVVAGFALGFAAGGFAGPALLDLLGGAEGLLAAAAITAGAFLVLVVLTRRRFPAELSVVDHEEVEAERATIRVLIRNRYVMLIVGFQMLSAVESQWLDFLVFDRAAHRYDDSDALAQFVSRFSAIAYGSDILFLLLLAGLLLRRFGLRYGLTANSLGVLTLVVAMIVAAAFQGPGATIVFVLIVSARVTDLVLSDGTSRTSLSAAYQAVPTRMRQVAQANVEGLAVPVAIGMSGVVLLVVRAAGRLNGSVLPVLTGGVVIAWAAVAFRLYREYRMNLLSSLRQRTLDPADLTLDLANSQIVIDRLVESNEERDVRLGLDILATAGYTALPATLARFVRDERISIRTHALERLAELDGQAAAPLARTGLDDPDSEMRAASIRVLGSVGDRSDLAAILMHSDDPAPDVEIAVAATLSRIGDDAAKGEVATRILRLSRSELPGDRVTAANMLREIDRGAGIDRTSLHDLIDDPDAQVVNAALGAMRWSEDADWVADVERHLRDGRTAGAAVEALVRGGDAVLAVVDRGFGDEEIGRHGQELLARVCREIGGPSAVDVLRRHVEHSDREVGLAVMRALAVLSERGERDTSESELVSGDLAHATHVLRALLVFHDNPKAALLCAALRDELELLRQRVLAGLSVRYGRDELNRIAFQFAQRDSRSHALALEWLDVTLTGTDRTAVAILEPDLSDRDRMNVLTRRFPVGPSSSRAVLLELVQDRDGEWRRPWIKACALYAAAGMPKVELDPILAVADDDADIVVETLAAIRAGRFRDL